jgi:glycosyltransferase involved in cell wall biosynthesis
MRIGIDAREMLYAINPTWEYYLQSLISALQKVDGTNQYVLFFSYFRKKFKSILDSYPLNGNFRKKALRIPHRITEFLFEDQHMPIETVLGKVDLFHGPIYTRLNNIHGKSVVTVHDLIFIREPEIVPPGWLAFTKKRIGYAMRKADAIITISEFSKSEILDVYKIPEGRVRVIHNGVGKEFFPRTEGIEQLKQEYGIRNRYFLYVGAVEPRKNLVNLLNAFQGLQPSLRDAYQLVVAGVTRYKDKELFRRVAELGLENEVVFTGRVPQEILPLLYSGAEIFIYPSLFEGFGMPPLEAMACGTPVIASNRTSVPEVLGDAALFVDPLNPAEITQSIKEILSDSSLRETCRQKGIERARLFSWERNAELTVSLYNELA